MNIELKIKALESISKANQEIQETKGSRIEVIYLKNNLLIVIGIPYFNAFDEDDIWFEIQALLEKHFESNGIKLIYEGDSILNRNKRYYKITE